MKKDIFKRILSVIMAVILCTGMLGGFSAFAAGEQVENYQLAFPRRGDVNYSDKWGHGKLKHMNGWFSDEAKYNTVFTIGSYSGPACYCIEPGTPIENKYKLTSRDESYWDNFPSEYNHTITVPDIKIFIGRIMQYGYTGNVSINWRTQNEADADSFSLYYATQLLIWETVVGERDSDFNHITPVGCNAILDKIGTEHPMKSRIMSHYNNIVAGVKTHTTTPSFCSKTPSGGGTRELKWDGSQYTATFTDTNNILQRFSFSADNGYTCRVAGNTLTVSGTAAPKGTVTVTAVKNTAGRKGIIVWGDGIVKPGVGQQDLATYAATVKDPITAFLRLRVSTGNIKIVKTSEDGRVDGITFRIKGNGVDKTVKTANGGSITADNLAPGEYTVTEETTEEYAEREAQHITVVSGQTSTVSFNNILKKGKIAIIKHSDDGSTKIETPEKGAEFEVFLKSAGSYASAKETERDTLVCDKNGFAETKALPYGEYTVKQTKGQSGREHIAPFNVFISEDGETYRFLINNAVFKSAVEIVKKDAETGKIIPAAGIGFKVRNTDTGKFVVQHITYPTPADIDTYYTDVTGKLMMPEKLPYGNYEIIEQCTAYGYVLDSAPIAFKVDGSKTVVTVEKHNMPQKGIVNISKSGEVFFSAVESDGVYSFVFADKGLAGAVYEITAAEDIITPDGTLRYAKGAVVDTVTTDENGSAASKPLYLGKYTVRETKAPYGMVLNDEAKSVELTYAGETVEVTETAAEFYNERQKAEVSLSKILGKDETFGIGNNGEILSVQFGLYAAEEMTAADGSVIPTDALLETAGCDENGKLTFKTDIPVGAKLYVKEIATDERYILSDEKYPVSFEYAGQKTALVKISANDDEAIKNNILYGSVRGLKIDRETESVIAGAMFGLFGWSLFVAGTVVAVFDTAIEYQCGKANVKTAALNILKGFFACSLIGVLPVELYKFCITLQNIFSRDLAALAAGTKSTGLSELSLSALTNFFLTDIEANISLFNTLSLVAFAYCIIKVFFANIKRGGILLIQMSVGALYMFSVPRGYADGFNQWCKQVIAICLTAFLQTTLLYLGLITFSANMLMGLGIMLAADEVPKIAQTFGLDSSVRVNMMNVVHATTTAVNLTRSVAKAV